MPNESKYGIDASDFRDAAKALDKAGFDRTAGKYVASGLRKAANAVRRGVRAEARPHRRTGKLNSGVRTYFEGIGLKFVAKVRTTGPIAHLIVGGVKPHEISASNAKALAIHARGRAGAVVGFAASVQNPGFRPDPYFHRGVERAASDINAAVQVSADQMTKELAYQMGRKH